MANAVSSQTLLNGARNCVVKVTNLSDGTNEADVVKVDASALGLPVDGSYRLERLEWAVNSVSGTNAIINVEWDGSTDALIASIPPNESGCFDFCKIGGLPNNASAPTGDITVTSTLSNNDAYTLVFHLVR